MMIHNHSYILLVMLIVVVQSIPGTISDKSTDEIGEFDQMKNNFPDKTSESEDTDSSYGPKKYVRHLSNVIDGTTHYLRAGGASYIQRIRDGQCFVEYDGRLATENSLLQIRRKLYRVEGCLLERVFHACGPNLLLMLNAVCRVVEKHQMITTTTTTTQSITVGPSRSRVFPSSRRLNPRADKTPRVITESCCENLCTLSELTRYCHR